MKKLEIKLNNKIKIIGEDGDYSSNVQDVSDDCISISIPVRQGSYLFLREEDFIEAVYYNEKELYYFKSKVLRRETGKVPIIVIEKPAYYKKIQRRNYVRIEHVLDAYYTLVEKEPKNNDLEIFFINNKDKLQKAIIADLSGGGCKLKVNEKLQYGNKVFLRLPIYGEEMNLICKVVREDEKENNLYIYGVSFSYVQESSREKLIKYVFEIMRQQRKRALKR